MRALKFILPFLLLCLSSESYGQTGLYGKRSIVEFQASGSMPLFYNFLLGGEQLLKRDGEGLSAGRNLFEYGYRVNFTHAVINQFGLGMEFGYERQLIAAPREVVLSAFNGSSTNDYLYDIRHEKVRLNTYTIMPKLEISTRSNLLPIGLSHQIGIGYTRASVDERNYRYFVDNPFNDSIVNDLSSNLFNFEDVYTGVTIMYQINMRTPVTDQFVISYGLRYNGNFVRRTIPTDGASPPGEFDRFIDHVRTRRNTAFVQLNIGVGFTF